MDELPAWIDAVDFQLLAKIILKTATDLPSFGQKTPFFGAKINENTWFLDSV
jgi:hypothetical protein